MAAAWDVLRRTSYDNLKIQAVIRVAGVSIGRFYRHFTGKQELVSELLRVELRRATAILDELTASGTPEDRVRAWVDGVVSLAYGRHAGPRARWFTSLPNEVLALLDGSSRDYRTSAPLEEAIAAGRASGGSIVCPAIPSAPRALRYPLRWYSHRACWAASRTSGETSDSAAVSRASPATGKTCLNWPIASAAAARTSAAMSR